jgi:hypothetical protein
MKISPRPVLLVIAVIQLCLLLVLLFSTFMSSLEQGDPKNFIRLTPETGSSIPTHPVPGVPLQFWATRLPGSHTSHMTVP